MNTLTIFLIYKDYSIYNNILLKSIGKSHKFKEILYQKTTNFFH